MGAKWTALLNKNVIIQTWIKFTYESEKKTPGI